MDRFIKFYTISDLSIGYESSKIIEALEIDSKSSICSINEAIQLYNVIRFLENGMFPQGLDADQIESLKGKIPTLRKKVSVFFSVLSEQNIVERISGLAIEYHEDALLLLGKYGIYGKISGETLIEITRTNHIQLRQMLHEKKLVERYEDLIKGLILSDEKNAELIIDLYLRSGYQDKIYLPQHISTDEKRELISKYLDSPNANPNFIDVIANSNERAAGLNTKIRLKARQKHDAWRKDFFSNNSGTSIGWEVRICEEQSSEILETFKDGVTKVSISKKWLEETLDFPSLMNNFIYLFGFTDSQMILKLASYPSELGVFERVMNLNAKRQYVTGISFTSKEKTSSMELHVYIQFLKEKEIDLENVLEWYYRDYLLENFNTLGFRFIPSSQNSSYIEKTRHLFVEMESLAKQFQTYVEEGELDWELLSATSEPVNYALIPSLITGKYLYGTDSNEANAISSLILSDQSFLAGSAKHENTRTFLELVETKHIKSDDFVEFQHHWLDLLAKQGIIQEVNGRLEFKDRERILLMKHVFDKGAASYYHYNLAVKKSADEMVKLGHLERKGTLLTKAEASYFNYYLNSSEFSNSLDLRNKYLHGTTGENNPHYESYISAIKLLLILTIKINDEFWLRHDLTEQSSAPL